MTLPLSNTFEGGTNGVLIGPGNSGGASGDAFDATTGTAPSYSTAQAMHGTHSMVLPASGGQVWWKPISVGTPTKLSGHLFIFFTQAPSFYTTVAGGLTPETTASSRFIVRVNTIGTHVGIQAMNGSFVASSISLSINTWYRLEFIFDASTSTCTTDCTIYAGDSLTPLETMTQATGTGGVNDTSVNGFQAGSTNSLTANTFYIDDIQIGGPTTTVPVPQPARATASVPAVQLKLTVPAPRPLATGAIPALQPKLTVSALPTASGSVPTVLIKLTIPPSPATATASAPTIQTDLTPSSTAAASVPLPILQITLFPAASAAAASVPTVLFSETMRPSLITARASLTTPTISVAITVSTAAAGSVPLPVVSISISAATTAAAAVPDPDITGGNPIVDVLAAAAAASAPVPIADVDVLMTPDPALASGFIRDDLMDLVLLLAPDSALAAASTAAGVFGMTDGLSAATAAASVPTPALILLGGVTASSALAAGRIPLPIVTFTSLAAPAPASAAASTSVTVRLNLAPGSVTATAAAPAPTVVGSSYTVVASATVPLPVILLVLAPDSASATSVCPAPSLDLRMLPPKPQALAIVAPPTIALGDGNVIITKARAFVPFPIRILHNDDSATAQGVSVIRSTELFTPRATDEQRFVGWRRHGIDEAIQDLPVDITSFSLGFWIRVNLGPIPIRSYLSIHSINEGEVPSHEWDGSKWVARSFTRTFIDSRPFDQNLPFRASDSFDFNIVLGEQGSCFFEIDTPGLAVTSNSPVRINQWYRVDLEANCSSNSWRADWMIDEIPQLSITSVQPTSSNWRSFSYGGVEATTDHREDFSFAGMAYDLTAKFPLPS